MGLDGIPHTRTSIRDYPLSLYPTCNCTTSKSGLLKNLSSYLYLLTTVVRSRRANTWEVVAIRGKLRTRMDLYLNIDPQRIIYLLWSFFRMPGNSSQERCIWGIPFRVHNCATQQISLSWGAYQWISLG